MVGSRCHRMWPNCKSLLDFLYILGNTFSFQNWAFMLFQPLDRKWSLTLCVSGIYHIWKAHCDGQASFWVKSPSNTMNQSWIWRAALSLQMLYSRRQTFRISILSSSSNRPFWQARAASWSILDCILKMGRGIHKAKQNGCLIFFNDKLLSLRLINWAKILNLVV